MGTQLIQKLFRSSTQSRLLVLGARWDNRLGIMSLSREFPDSQGLASAILFLSSSLVRFVELEHDLTRSCKSADQLTHAIGMHEAVSKAGLVVRDVVG